jgi:hypothetical protein
LNFCLAFARAIYQIENPPYMLDGLKVDVDRALTKSSTYFGTLDNHSLNVGLFLAEPDRTIRAY